MLRFSFYLLLLISVALVAASGAVMWRIVPELPSIETLREVKLQTPLRVYSSDGALIGEFGEMRRKPVAIKDVPPLVKHAFLAAEDDRFYEHPGVDWMAIVRAGVELFRTRHARQGGSTITMQVARNFFLSPERTFERKLKEIMLAVKIEHELSKDEILELYLNKIFLGQRAYGIGAAAQVYFGVDLNDLSVAQIALIAGLPKAPSKLNPVANPAAAKQRRAYVLRRMFELGYIDRHRYDEALAVPLETHVHGQESEVPAPYVAEMVRAYMQDHYGEKAYSAGYRVFTTITSATQQKAVDALQSALIDYDRRHGYRGAEAHAELEAQPEEAALVEALEAYPSLGGLESALVLAVAEHDIDVFTASGQRLKIAWEGLSWARRYVDQDSLGSAPRRASDIVQRGDVVRVQCVVPSAKPQGKETAEPAGYWRLAQVPAVEGALVSIDSRDGAILALVGGFDFEKSKFNRITQAQRQPGSNFKPFIYSAALDHGFTPASFINDAPIVFDAPGLENEWRPENYTRKYYGPTRLREALANSRNLVSIRLLREIGVDTAIEHVTHFGFRADRLPKNLSLALGTCVVTPLELVTGYAAFSNGGFRISPYFVAHVDTPDGQRVATANPALACAECEQGAVIGQDEPADLEALQAQQRQPETPVAPRAIDKQNAWLMYSMLKDVILHGTAQSARSMKRPDIAGKTGTTNDQKDAWFSGFNGRIVTTTWMGFDQTAPLGKVETGARAALPMWMDYMAFVLKDLPPSEMERPTGLVTVRIDPRTGLLANAGDPDAIFETFRESDVPRTAAAGDSSDGSAEKQSGGGGATDDLF